MSIGGARRFIRRTKEFAASCISIMNLRVVTAGSRTPDAIFDIGSARRDLSKLMLRHRLFPTPTRPQRGNGPIPMPTAHCTPTLPRNLWNMALPPVPNSRQSPLPGVPGASIQTHCGASPTPKWLRGSDSEEIGGRPLSTPALGQTDTLGSDRDCRRQQVDR